jgi:hypothetical protein
MVNDLRYAAISISVLVFGWLLSGCGGGAPPVTPSTSIAQGFSCPAGQADMMEYFVMSKQNRDSQFMNGQQNPPYTEVFPDQDFAASGYWFWLKSASAHGFDVKVFDQNYIYMRSTELVWADTRHSNDLSVTCRLPFVVWHRALRGLKL